jgi:hypothetical protein
MRALPLAASTLLALAPPASAVVITLSETTSTIIVDANSVACGTATESTDNTYYRAFAFADFGIDTDFTVSRVDFGVEKASSPSMSQSLTLTLYEGTSLSPLGPVAASDTFDIADQTLTTVSHPIAGVVPFASGGLVVGLFSEGAGNLFLIGSNSAGETAPGYVLAPGCGLDEPTALGTIDPEIHILISVTGEPAPEPARWLLLLSGAGALFGFESRSGLMALRIFRRGRAEAGSAAPGAA